MHCLIKILYLYAYCFYCKLCKMCQSSFFSNSPQILWGFSDEGYNLVCQIEIPWLLLLYRERMLHKSQNEVASQLFLLHSYHQSKIYGCQSRSELHYMLISFVLSCVTMLLSDKSVYGSVLASKEALPDI